MSYFYKLTPLFAIGTICILALPWLGLIALFVVSLFVVSLFVLPALFLAIVHVPYRIGRAINNSMESRSAAHLRPIGGLNR